MATTAKRVKVTFDAVVQRLSRRLARDDRAIRSPRGRAKRTDLGDHYLVDLIKNVVVETKLTPKRIEALARQLDVIEPWEEVR